VWMARILLTWGVIATLTGFVQSASQLYWARFALGLAEAGYFPGIVHYLGYWFRQREKAQATAIILMGIPLASILGAPVSGLILDHVHWVGLSSWRWLFILEGFPAIIGAFLTRNFLPSRPADAAFLTAEQQREVIDAVKQEDRAKVAAAIPTWIATLRVSQLSIMGFCHAFGQYTFNFWLPQIFKSTFTGVSNTAVGFLVTVPNVLGLGVMIAVCQHSDRTLERRYHMALSIALGGLALMVLGAPRSAGETLALFSVVAIGAYSFLPIFFTVPGAFLSGYGAAAAIAVIASVSNIGGFAGPYIVGVMQRGGLVIAGVLYLVAAVLSLALPRAPVALRTMA